MPVDTAMVAIHNLFAALWVGSVLFVTYAVLPQAREGEIGPDVLRAVFGKLTMVTRVSALLLLLTGGHLAAARYTSDSLLTTTRGWLVLAMLALWFVLAGLIEVTTSKFETELDKGRLRGPAHKYTKLFYLASLVGVLLVIDAALLSDGIPF